MAAPPLIPPLPRSPQRWSSVLLVFVAASTVFLDYWQYSKSFYAEPNIWASTLNGTTDAPAQYRIGVIQAADFLTRHAHMGMRHALGLIDFVALLIAAFILRAMLTRSPVWRGATPAAQWFGAAVFILLLQYSLTWLVWYQRPETLSIAALLALSFSITAFGLPIPGAAGKALAAVSLIAVGLLQGVTRADVGFTFHLGVALACLFFSSNRTAGQASSANALPRWAQFFTSLVAAGAAAAVQLYLMRVVYPQATYGATAMIQLKLNITDRLRIFPFVFFLLPVAWTVLQLGRRSLRVSRAEAGLLLGAAMFFAMWCVFGKIDEVRIFLPFAFALTPMTVTAVMDRIRALENVSRDIRPGHTVS